MKNFKLRDFVFAIMGGYILYHEVVEVDTAEPLLIFAAFFLLGLIPASRADDGSLRFREMLLGWLSNGSSETSKKKRGDDDDESAIES